MKILQTLNILWVGLTVLAAPMAAQAEDICDGAQLEQKATACGLDMACINRLMSEYNAQCTGAQGAGGAGGMGSDAMARVQACGMEQGCLQRLSEEFQEDYRTEDPDTTNRLAERTVLAPSWLQSYQEALVVCGKAEACWLGHMGAAQQHIQGVCGQNMMNEATMLCQLAARYEIHIEQAIAQQRLWRKGVRFEEDAPGAMPPAEMPEDPGHGSTGSGEIAMEGGAALGVIPEIDSAQLATILAPWEQRVGQSMSQETRDELAARAADIPLEADPGVPPLVFDDESAAGGSALAARATRRDWHYALTAVLLTESGLSQGGQEGGKLLDAAMWCLLRAAALHPEVEHYANIGFHLNLRGEVADARDVLAYAFRMDGHHPDTQNNLAFSYSALGQQDEALALQANALRLAPDNGHIRSRLAAMQGKGDKAMPYGGDFGEAFFRLGKRHALREYEAGKAWFKAREEAKNSIFGGMPVVPGPYSWHAERLRDIEAARTACGGNAPEVLKGCPFGAGAVHPACANAATPEQVERSQHNRNVHLCQCAANAIMARADALSAWLDRAIASWRTHEEAWWPRLAAYAQAWSTDIKQVNKRYQGTNFKFPVASGYASWPEEFEEDSREAWTEEIPEIGQQWFELKSQAQNLKNCGTTLPPIADPPKAPPTPKAQPKVKTWGINLFIVEFSLSLDGSFKAGFDLGIVKGGYERIAGVDGHKFTVGSGSIEFSYQHNGAPRPGGDSSTVSFTVGANFFKFIPGAGGAGATIADQFFSFGSKFEGSWGNKTGWGGKTSVESKSKFGFSTREVRLAPATSMLN